MHAPLNPERATHDPKFSTVNWYGEQYSFSPPQARCIAVLWRFWMQGTPVIREEMILEVAGIKTRSLKDVFATGPGKNAWGHMIGTGDRRGTAQLVTPADDAARASPLVSPPSSGTDDRGVEATA
jgi:hypothetical protein